MSLSIDSNRVLHSRNQVRVLPVTYSSFPEHPVACRYVRRYSVTVHSLTMPQTRVSSVALEHLLKPISLWVTISHIMQGREKRDVRDILLSCVRKFLLRSLTTTSKSNRTRRSHSDAIQECRTESSCRAVPIMVLAREKPSRKGAKWAVNLIDLSPTPEREAIV
jgi:hypothetical protein